MSVMEWLVNHSKIVISSMTAIFVAGTTIAMSRKHIDVARVRQQKTGDEEIEILAMGMTAMTWRIHDCVLKLVHI